MYAYRAGGKTIRSIRTADRLSANSVSGKRGNQGCDGRSVLPVHKPHEGFRQNNGNLNGIPVGLENIRITVYLPRHIGGSLQQEVVVTVQQAIRLRPSSVVLSVFINTIFLPFASEVAEGSITWK